MSCIRTCKNDVDRPTHATAVMQIQRDKNHPSIILWSCGNESGFGKAHSDMANFYRQLDPSRPPHYEVSPHVVVTLCCLHTYNSTTYSTSATTSLSHCDGSCTLSDVLCMY